MTRMARERTNRSSTTPIPALGLGVTHQLAAPGGGQAATPPFGETTTVIRIVADDWARIAVGPDAAVQPGGGALLPPGAVEYVRVEAGWRLAMRPLSGSVAATVSECN